VARGIDPQEAAVITVGALRAGQDNNVIPGEASLGINLRWFNPAVRETLIQGIRAVNEAIVRSYRPTEF